VLEEDVHELPEHVVGGLDELLSDERIVDLRHQLPFGARLLERDRQAPARPRERQRPRRLGIGRLEGDRDVVGLGD
jgi:hypothetical protein